MLTLTRALSAAVLAAGVSAHAGILVLTLENGDDGGQPFNTTYFTITNTSAPGVTLDRVTLTIGDDAYNFDQLYERREAFLNGNGTQAAALLIGDRFQDGAVTDLFRYGFTNFGAGVTFTGQWDIDPDGPPGAFEANARTVLFSNGAAPNAVLTAEFSDGVVEYTFPDLPSQESYSITIPAPGGAVPLAAAGLVLRRRRAR